MTEKTILKIGTMPHGPRNLITDVPGVKVGHVTVDTEINHTGVTVVVPCPENPYTHPLTAATFVLNGFGKSAGLMQIDELGTLETPIALTNTLNVGLVHDGLVTYMIYMCQAEGVKLRSVNPIVCECNDGGINEITHRAIGEKEVLACIEGASEDFALGAVGAGRGTVCYGLKGGIGSASRQMVLDGKTYTLGVLVQSNYGASRDLRLASLPEDIAECDQGSIILITATDLPLSSRQLRRVIKRTSVGMARLGSYIGHGSGEVMVGFTTNRPEKVSEHVYAQSIVEESFLNEAFRAAGEAAEEAILRSMLCAGPDVKMDGTRVASLREYLEKHGK